MLKFNQTKQFLIVVFFFSLIQIVHCQFDLSEDAYYKVYDDYIGLENSELNNGVIVLQQYRTMDKSHMFFGKPEFREGKVIYKNQGYSTKLKYDLLNDLVIIKNDAANNTLPISLNSKLVGRFIIDNRSFVKLPVQKNLEFLFENGFFEEVFKGDKFNLYIKHRKDLKKNTNRSRIFYFFLEEQIYLMKYENKFYEINNKRDIIKAVPHLKQEIKDFYRPLSTINTEWLTQLFITIDKKDSQ